MAANTTSNTTFKPSPILTKLFLKNFGRNVKSFEEFGVEQGRAVVRAIRAVIHEISAEGYEDYHVLLSHKGRLIPCFTEKLARLLEIKLEYQDDIFGALYQELRPLARSEKVEEKEVGTFTIREGNFVITLDEMAYA